MGLTDSRLVFLPALYVIELVRNNRMFMAKERKPTKCGQKDEQCGHLQFYVWVRRLMTTVYSSKQYISFFFLEKLRESLQFLLSTRKRSAHLNSMPHMVTVITSLRIQSMKNRRCIHTFCTALLIPVVRH